MSAISVEGIPFSVRRSGALGVITDAAGFQMDLFNAESEGAAGRAVQAIATGLQKRIADPVREAKKVLSADPPDPSAALQRASVPKWAGDFLLAARQGQRRRARDIVRPVVMKIIERAKVNAQPQRHNRTDREKVRDNLRRVTRSEPSEATVDRFLEILAKGTTGVSGGVHTFEGRIVTEREKERLRAQRRAEFRNQAEEREKEWERNFVQEVLDTDRTPEQQRAWIEKVISGQGLSAKRAARIRKLYESKVVRPEPNPEPEPDTGPEPVIPPEGDPPLLQAGIPVLIGIVVIGLLFSRMGN